jgi:hypothetical protein
MSVTFTRTGAQIEEIHNTVDDPKSNVQFSDDIRTIAGEYRGLWPDTGGSANKGDTYQTQLSGAPTGQYFTALQNTTVDPVSDNVNWRSAPSFPQFDAIDISGLSSSTDNRNFIYSLGSDVYVGKGYTIRCNFLPDDDVRIFKGEGVVLSLDQWGNEHSFDVFLANNGSVKSPNQLINQGCKLGSNVGIGILGDSVTSGAFSTGWSNPPVDGSNNFSSTNYNHSASGSGGFDSWFRSFITQVNGISGVNAVSGFNCSLGGQKLIDGWAHRNYDYGFFQNAAYNNRNPDVLYIAMGINDDTDINGNADVLKYLDEFDKLIRKAWGYRSSVGLISISNVNLTIQYLEGTVKKYLMEKYPQLSYIDLAEHLDRYKRSGDMDIQTMWRDPTRGYNIIHPQTELHRFMGGAAAYDVLRSNVHLASIGSKLIVSSQNDALCTSGANVNMMPTLQDVSGSYLDELKGWATWLTPSATAAINYWIWVEDTQTSMIVFEPTQHDYTTADRTNTVSVVAHDVFNTPEVYNLGSNGLASFSDYKTLKVSRLRYGLNRVRVLIGGNPSKVYAPALFFQKSVENTVVGRISQNLPPESLSPVSLLGVKPNLLDIRFQPTSAEGESSDIIDSSSLTRFGYVEFSSNNNCGLSIFSKSKADKGVYCIKTSDTNMDIKESDGSLIQSITGDFSGSIILSWASTLSESRVDVTDTSGTFTRVTLDFKFRGGGCDAVNESLSTRLLSVFGGYLFG